MAVAQVDVDELTELLPLAREKASDSDALRRSLQHLQRTAEGSKCFAAAFERMQQGCVEIAENDDVKRRFAFRLTRCHLKDSGRHNVPAECRPRAPVRECIGGLTDAGFHTFSLLFTHADNTCHFLAQRAFRMRTVESVGALLRSNNVAQQGMEEIAGSLSDLQLAQADLAGELDRSAAELNGSMSAMLDGFSSDFRDIHDSMEGIGNTANTVLRLQNRITANVELFGGALWYTGLAACVLGATGLPSTLGARPVALFLMVLGILAEYCLRGVWVERARSVASATEPPLDPFATAVPNASGLRLFTLLGTTTVLLPCDWTIHELVWAARYLGVAVLVVVVIRSALRHRDWSQETFHAVERLPQLFERVVRQHMEAAAQDNSSGGHARAGRSRSPSAAWSSERSASPESICPVAGLPGASGLPVVYEASEESTLGSDADYDPSRSELLVSTTREPLMAFADRDPHCAAFEEAWQGEDCGLGRDPVFVGMLDSVKAYEGDRGTVSDGEHDPSGDEDAAGSERLWDFSAPDTPTSQDPIEPRSPNPTRACRSKSRSPRFAGRVPGESPAQFAGAVERRRRLSAWRLGLLASCTDPECAEEDED